MRWSVTASITLEAVEVVAVSRHRPHLTASWPGSDC